MGRIEENTSMCISKTDVLWVYLPAFIYNRFIDDCRLGCHEVVGLCRLVYNFAWKWSGQDLSKARRSYAFMSCVAKC